jgi:hypothetical protein
LTLPPCNPDDELTEAVFCTISAASENPPHRVHTQIMALSLQRAAVTASIADVDVCSTPHPA